ncbi:hypothetical protein L596_019976 [Steinernema carpocapsae]|uniref:Uncharacterized protein n=1 Tax=Steinernema carpocapsae TaxID=34508 RepID=A0A4U5MSA5_STECR|nr:hypothetical protein L596_019976 [Steinernema carpocapsae]
MITTATRIHWATRSNNGLLLLAKHTNRDNGEQQLVINCNQCGGVWSNLGLTPGSDGSNPAFVVLGRRLIFVGVSDDTLRRLLLILAGSAESFVMVITTYSSFTCPTRTIRERRERTGRTCTFSCP